MNKSNDGRLSSASTQSYSMRAIQNFPDYLRHVARKSKAGFDKVHEEIHRIYHGTADKVSQDTDHAKKSKINRRSRWSNSVKSGGLLWSSTGSLKPETSFTSYIAEETQLEIEASLQDKGGVNPQVDIKEPHSASLVQKTTNEFNFENFRYSDILERSIETSENEADDGEYKSPTTWLGGEKRSANKCNTSITNIQTPTSTTNTVNTKRKVTPPTTCKLTVTSNDNDDGYLTMNNQRPIPKSTTDKTTDSSRGILKTQSNAVDTDYVSLNTDTDYQNVGKLLEWQKESAGDYMNAPIKPIRYPEPDSPGSNFAEEEDIYKVPPNTQFCSVKPIHKNKLISSQMVGNKIADKDVGKSNSKPEIAPDSDDFYQVPPGAIRRAKTVDIVISHDDEEDFYQVPPSPVKVVHKKPAPTPRISKLHPTETDREEVYEVPPSPRKIDKTSPDTSKHEQNEIFYGYTVAQVVQCLNDCQLSRMATVCEEQQLNGEYFRNKMMDDLKENPFEMNWFYISKFVKVLGGWRPKGKT